MNIQLRHLQDLLVEYLNVLPVDSINILPEIKDIIYSPINPRDISIEAKEKFEFFKNNRLAHDSHYKSLLNKYNTYKLLKGLKESGAFDKIQEYIQNNGIVVGCSAGAVVCGKDIDIIAKIENQSGVDNIEEI